jgi:uncharacterized protein (DUF1684 family)
MKFHHAIRQMLFTGIVLGLGLALTPAHAADKTSAENQAYAKDFAKWKAELVASRKKNWLSLVGLFWLKEGTNSFGSDKSNPVVLPAGKIAARAGVFTLHGKQVTVEIAAGSHATIDGKNVETAQLQSDATDKPTVLEMGSLRMHVIERGPRIGIRAKDVNSVASKTYSGPVFYPINLAYRVTAKLIPATGKQMVNVPDVLGDIIPVPSAGTVVFEINGKEYRLVDLGGDANGLSFVFNDLTRKTDTYPGGRFLDTGPVVNGTVVLDFNRAYNPPCSVTPYATCPLAPPEDRLDVAIPAGEKYDRKHTYYSHSE